jgi:hypothetical protein
MESRTFREFANFVKNALYQSEDSADRQVLERPQNGAGPGCKEMESSELLLGMHRIRSRP